MRILLWVLCVALLLVSCDQAQQGGSGNAGRTFAAGGGAMVSGWLDHSKPVYEHQVFSAPAGSDIRMAALWLPGQTAASEVVAITRNYESRVEGEADTQSIYRVKLPGSAEQQEAQGLPLDLVVSPNRQTVCLASLSQTGVGTFSQEQVSIDVWQGEGQPRRVALDSQALPAEYLGDDALQLEEVDSFQLEGGLLAPAISRGASGFVLRLDDLQLRPTSTVYLLNRDSSLAATMKQAFDPADPAAGTVAISLLPWPQGGRPPLCAYEFPLHVSYSPFAWQPQLAWIDDDRLAAQVFMPELAGEGKRANFHGLFKLVTLDTAGSVTLVEDHLSGDLPFRTSGGVLFYTRRTTAGDSQRWEVWAASADGMYKRLVWNSEEPIYISLEDADARSFLLLQVQSLKVTSGEVALESRLIALSLEPVKPPAPDAARSGVGDVPAGPAGSKPPPITVPEDD